MEEFNQLIDTLKRLIAPEGCPWDREQTLHSMRHSVVEETFEVVEAIDLDDNGLIKEELGDLLFNAFFLCILAEKEGRFSFQEAVQQIVAKIIHRHPHVFGTQRLNTTDEVLKQWDAIKKEEKKEERKSLLDGIPKDLPALTKAHKFAKKLANTQFSSQKSPESFNPEDRAGEFLWKAVQTLYHEGIQAEHALRKRLTQIEGEFREWEKESGR